MHEPRSLFTHPRQTVMAQGIVGLAYLSALLGPTAVVIGKFIWVDPSEDAPFLLFFAQIVLAGSIGGLRPALLATGVSTLWVSFLLIPPVASFHVADPDLVRTLTFTVEGLAVSALVGWLHRSWRDSREALAATRAANDRVREAWRDRSAVLAEASNEIRQPLSRLLAQLQVARAQIDQSDRQRALAERLDSAIDAARSLDERTKEVLEVARAEVGLKNGTNGPSRRRTHR